MKRAILAAFLVALAASPVVGATDASAYSQTGVASYYSMGKRTANGERYRPDGISAAHRSLPFGTRVKVTHLKSGRSIIVRINDRGPFIKGRIIDLSRGAAGALGIKGAGLARVRIEVVGNGAGTVQTARKTKTKSKKTYTASATANGNKKISVNLTAKKTKSKKKTSMQVAAFVEPASTEALNATSYQKIASKK